MPLALRFVISALCLVVASFGARRSVAAEPLLEKSAPFIAGELGYKMFRIPGVVVTARGTVLVYSEARKTAGDWAAIDIMMRRSLDNGKTFLEPQKIAHRGARLPKNPVSLRMKNVNPDDQTTNNPVAIADRDGTVNFLYCVEYGRCFSMRSTDDGATWSEPVEITATFDAFRPEYPWKVIATGPAHGIQLRTGRLVVPIWMSTGTGGNAHRPSVTATIFSDDHGRTWQRGAIAVPDTAEWIFPNETIAAELADGRVMLNVRTESKTNRRLITVSPDGASNWSKPEFHEELLEPICMASMVRLSTSPPSDKNRLLFSNPNTLEAVPGKAAKPGAVRSRKNVTVRLSYDEGKTWPVARALEQDLSGYSDLAVGKDGTIFCLYEDSTTDKSIYNTGRLTFARFNLEWLTEGRDSLPATKESSK